MKTLLTRGLMVTTALTVVGIGTTAHAQVADNSSVAAPQNGASATDRQAAIQDGSSTSPEIIVTGLKRNARLQTIPVAVSAFDEKAIAATGIKEVTDLLQMTPNINSYSAQNKSDFFINIRGQASIRDAEPSVRVIIDGVPAATASEYNAELVGIKQIEIFRGPQSAYYGRDASGGAIVITTNEPSDEWGAQVTGSYGNWNSIRSNASFGGPIVDTLKMQATVAQSSTDGPFTNINTGEKSQRYANQIGRLRFIWEPSENLKLDLRGSYQHYTAGAYANLPKLGITPLNPNGILIGGKLSTSVDTNALDYPFVTNTPGRSVGSIYSTSLKADYKMPWAVFTSITSWSHNQQIYGGKNFPYGNPADPTTDFGGWTAILGDRTQNYSDRYVQFDQEFRLTSTGSGPLQWQIGVEYLHISKLRYRNNALDGAIPAGQDPLGYVGYNAAGERTLIGGGTTVPDPSILYGVNSANPSISYNAIVQSGYDIGPFANAQYELTDRLKLDVAARYDIEARHTATTGFAGINPLTGVSYNNCVNILGWTLGQCAAGEDKTFRQIQPKVTLTYKAPSFGIVYASWGIGFKTGGFNELGTRQQLIAARVPIFLATAGTTLAQAQALAAASVYTQDTYAKEVANNFEFGFKGTFLDGRLRFNAAAFLTKTKNAQSYGFDNIAVIGAISNLDRTTIKGVEFDTNIRATDDLSLFASGGYVDAKITKLASNPSFVGNRLPYVPKFNFAVGVQLDKPMSDDLRLQGRVEYDGTGPTYFDIQNTPDTVRNTYGVLDARLGVEYKNLNVTLWVKNALNKKYATEAVVVLPFLTGIGLAPTRSFGLEARYSF